MTLGESIWQPAPANLYLASDEIHLWRASLDQATTSVDQLAETLSADERHRAERFFFERDRLHFIVGRGLLRIILGRYTGIEPSRLEFHYGLRGKPAIVPTPDNANLHFNISHSDGLALYAVARDRELGVDLEHIRPISDIEEIAERFFSAAENAALRNIPPSSKLEAFFTCWTRKEAYIKATGHGLSLPLDQFDVALVPGTISALLKIRGDRDAASRWLLQEIAVAPSYVAALAVEGRVWHFHYWTCPDVADRTQERASVIRSTKQPPTP